MHRTQLAHLQIINIIIAEIKLNSCNLIKGCIHAGYNLFYSVLGIVVIFKPIKIWSTVANSLDFYILAAIEAVIVQNRFRCSKEDYADHFYFMKLKYG